MSNLYPLTGVTLPDSPPYSTDGHLIAKLHEPGGATFTYENFNGKIGSSDIHGDLKYVASQPRPKLSGKLVSNQLLMADLGPLIGADSNAKQKARGGESKQPAGKVLPVEEFRTERWRDMDADVELTGKRIVQSAELPFTDLYTHVVLNDGELSLEPLRFGVAGGKLENIYRLQIMNATEGVQRYRIATRGLEGLHVATDNEVEIGPAESRWVVVRLQLPFGAAPQGSHTVHFDVQALGDGAQVSEKSVFLVPR